MAKSTSAPAPSKPTEDEISRRAYELFLQRGSEPGHETDDWLQAEYELSQRSADTAGGDHQTEGSAALPISTPPDKRANGRREPTPAGGRRALRQ